MSIIEAIRFCHTHSDGESCHKCAAWHEENYICQNVRQMGEEFAGRLLEEFENKSIITE